MEELTKEQLEKILIKIKDELELYLLENHVNEVIKNLHVSLHLLNEYESGDSSVVEDIFND